ncbi:Icc-related predicted phosphoesterase [Pullulanibacillus pueri]|uniref:Metallophosphoesterase n=1 Tax=Pullulanibacillus pueri TaxID=1437324 RepID=A0A8J2ZUB0_9BACL|nr:metallophosphoesterase [Pullulanibacillus pueri]MBM7681145.1 Icc-related predicted phosphoesterase [Pullulanibacillus pueri]GGH77221.1 metallophosphoesterase [Pullulanibacillus pueri]
MRLVYASDLHGNKDHYIQLRKYVQKMNVEALILGGDYFKYTINPNEQFVFMEVFFIPFIHSLSIPVYLIAGNVDLSNVYEQLKISLHNLEVYFLERHPCYIDESISIHGLPYTPPSPFKLKNFERRDLRFDDVKIDSNAFILNNKNAPNTISEDYLNQLPSIEEEIQGFFGLNAIWVIHTPPYGGVLDVIHNGRFVGSKAVRNKIIKEQPLLTLHGHIHESPHLSGQWIERIGKTVSVNPGQGQELHAVIIDINAQKKTIALEHTLFGKYQM